MTERWICGMEWKTRKKKQNDKTFLLQLDNENDIRHEHETFDVFLILFTFYLYKFFLNTFHPFFYETEAETGVLTMLYFVNGAVDCYFTPLLNRLLCSLGWLELLLSLCNMDSGMECDPCAVHLQRPIFLLLDFHFQEIFFSNFLNREFTRNKFAVFLSFLCGFVSLCRSDEGFFTVTVTLSSPLILCVGSVSEERKVQWQKNVTSKQ